MKRKKKESGILWRCVKVIRFFRYFNREPLQLDRKPLKKINRMNK